MANEKEILIKHFEVYGKLGTNWNAVQAYLTQLDPCFLTETDVHNNWSEWVSDLDKTELGIVMHPTDDNTAHAICNFPYGTKGIIRLTTTGEMPYNCRVLLSDCYLDRLNFLPNQHAEEYEKVIGTPYTELKPNSAGVWEIKWDESNVTLCVNGTVIQKQPKHTDGFNHVTVLFHDQGELALTAFSAHSDAMAWKTGIEY